MLSALPAEMISQVIDIVDTMPETGLYEHFKNQFLEVHELSDYEKFNVLVKMEPMGRRKPMQPAVAPHAGILPGGYEETSLLPLSLHAATASGSPDTVRRGAAGGPARTGHAC